MKTATEKSIELIQVLNRSILVLGVQEVVKYLKWITHVFSEKSNIYDLVIYSVCQKYNLKPSQLSDGKKSHGKRNDAICIISFLLYTYGFMSQTEIAKQFKKHRSQVCMYIKRMQNLNVNLFKDDKVLYSNYMEIKESIDKVILIDTDQWTHQNAEADQEK